MSNNEITGGCLDCAEGTCALPAGHMAFTADDLADSYIATEVGMEDSVPVVVSPDGGVESLADWVQNLPATQRMERRDMKVTVGDDLSMTDMLEANIRFMTLANQVGTPIGWQMTSESNLERRAARLKMLTDEFQEHVDGERAHDLVEILDGLADIAYVALGSLVAYVGPRLARAVVNEVIRTNLAKVVGPGLPIVNEWGKVMKPQGWTPPDIAAIVAEFRQMRDSHSHGF